MRINTDSLTTKQRRYIQFAVIITLGIFLSIYFLFFNKKASIAPTIEKNNSVYVENTILHVFGDTASLAQFPNRMFIHYPYLLVVKPYEKITNIYNLEQKKKEKDINEAILDYSVDGILKNDGKTTFFNDRDLGLLCEKGYVKNATEILCLTKIDLDYVENRLININPNTLLIKELYRAKDLVTDFSVINDKIYIGEIDFYTKKSYIIDGEKKIEVPSVISMFYPMDNKPYLASFKSELNGNTESYYLIEDEKVTPQQGKIYILR